MIIKLLSKQVPQLWDSIKYASSHVNRINGNELQKYLNTLLHALLNDKAQCFIRVSEEKKLQALALTRFVQDEVTGDKSLLVECLYSFEPVDQPQWESDMSFIRKVAESNKCKKIITYSNNERVFDIVTSIGFSERYRCFAINLEA